MPAIRMLPLAVAFLAVAPSVAPAQESGPVAATDRGRVRGSVADGVASWKGIPFAAPPVGELRWRAPQPAPAWKGVRDTVAYAADCMQKPFDSDAAPLGTTPAEDCLYANVWKPAGARAKLPIVLWIYGGGFVNGGSSPPTYSGHNLARQGVMFVSFNYRLGRFGTFAHPQLSKENADGGLLVNYGIMDQIAALKWLQRNAAAFGGDPSNVTIVGESAGGMAVHVLNTSPLARGLFSKAIVMSGGNARSDERRIADVEKIGVDFARSKGIDPASPDALKRLRALSAEDVTDGLSLTELFQPKAGPRTFGSPAVDGRVIVDLGAAYAAKQSAGVPMMIGATSADSGGKFGNMIAGARDAARGISATGAPVYYYRFSYVAESLGHSGAQHATDIPFFFDTAGVKYGDRTTPKDLAMAKAISAYIVRFAKTGTPSGPGLPAWPRVTAGGDEMIDFAADAVPVALRDPWGKEMDEAAARLERARALGHYTTLTTPLGTLLDDAAARAVLGRHVPDLLRSPHLDMARGATLEMLQPHVPLLTPATLAAIDAELARVKIKAK